MHGTGKDEGFLGGYLLKNGPLMRGMMNFDRANMASTFNSLKEGG